MSCSGMGFEEPPARYTKSPRTVFLPRVLREHDLQDAGTATHGWLESPDHAPVQTPSRDHISEVNEEVRAPTGAQRQKSSEVQDERISIEWLDEVPLSVRGDAALERARRRNVQRLREATASDCKILSKYLPSDVSVFFPFGLVGPDDHFQPSQGWVNELLEVAKATCTVPAPPHVRLGQDQEDLDYNTRFLANCDWDLEEVFRQHVGTTVDHGSEFRPVAQLRRIVGSHPGFAYLEEMLTSGFDYHLGRELSEQERTEELRAQLDRGNHKSAQ